MDGAIASPQKDKIITISPEVMAQKLADLLPKQVFNRACAKYSRLMNPKTSIPPAFKGLFTHKRYKIYYGGRGGAKSHSFARALVKMAAEKPLRILCTREFQSSIADSVHRLISDCIHESKLGDYFTITKTTISSSVGSVFIFKGLRRSINEIKSTEGVDICWIEEAQSISNTSWEILIPTIRKENSEIWISFNPCEETDPTYQRFIMHTPPSALCQKVGYADNPYLPSTLEAERCYMLEVDPEAYAHVWGGECRTISDAVIFRGRFEVDDFDPPPPGTRLYYGVDWGFSQDPVALVRCWISGDKLYVDQEAWGIGVELDHLPDLFASVPGSRDWRIEADNSRPETVSHVKRRGFNIVSAPKWSGSIEDGLAVLKGFRKIVIHPRCRHAQEEFRLYSYKTDPLTNEILPIILDKHNHVIDALRYALSGIIKSNNFFDDIVMKDYPEEDNTTIFDDVKSKDRMATRDYPDE